MNFIVGTENVNKQRNDPMYTHMVSLALIIFVVINKHGNDFPIGSNVIGMIYPVRVRVVAILNLINKNRHKNPETLSLIQLE